jgi:hypothetical protein
MNASFASIEKFVRTFCDFFVSRRQAVLGDPSRGNARRTGLVSDNRAKLSQLRAVHAGFRIDKRPRNAKKAVIKLRANLYETCLMRPFFKTWLTLCLLLPLAAHATNREQRLPNINGYTPKSHVSAPSSKNKQGVQRVSTAHSRLVPPMATKTTSNVLAAP